MSRTSWYLDSRLNEYRQAGEYFIVNWRKPCVELAVTSAKREISNKDTFLVWRREKGSSTQCLCQFTIKYSPAVDFRKKEQLVSNYEQQYTNGAKLKPIAPFLSVAISFFKTVMGIFVSSFRNKLTNILITVFENEMATERNGAIGFSFTPLVCCCS